MVKIVGIRFKSVGKIYYFDPLDIDVRMGQDVIVETARGVEFGKAVIGPRNIEEEKLNNPLKPIIRIATTDDSIKYLENREKAKECFQVCKEKVKKHELDMFLIDCEYTFDRNKLIFYFTAEGRVDFRELVKDLASIFKTRIELRQIGVRDEAKVIDGIGPCGRRLCCSSWISEFQPVFIKMAKDQSLSLNPTKISGVCGRLFCCLKYEHEVYQDLISKLPAVGSIVKVYDGNKKGKVQDIHPLSGKIKVELEDRSVMFLEEVEYKVIKDGKSKNAKGERIDKHTMKELKKLEG